MGSIDGPSHGTDPLTGVADRAQFLRWLDDAVAGGPQPGGRRSGVLLVDLDDFTTVNDVRGYQVGDRILIAVAKLLSDAVHDSHAYRYRDVAALAAELGILAVAKAVESAAQAERLHELGLSARDGFRLRGPQPAAAIPLFLANEVVHVI